LLVTSDRVTYRSIAIPTPTANTSSIGNMNRPPEEKNPAIE
jgi:hypothetical protein